MPFAGLRVLSLESRRAKEMEGMILRLGGDAFVAPSVQERALDDHGEALRFIDRLEAGEFDLLVCMTGTGMVLPARSGCRGSDMPAGAVWPSRAAAA